MLRPVLLLAVCLTFAGCSLLPAPPREWGVIPVVPAVTNVAGVYSSMNLTLALLSDGTYKTRQHACFGPYEEFYGKWTLAENRVILDPPFLFWNEEWPSLDVLRHRENWILVQTAGREREWYNRRGISNHSCFQLETVLQAARK